MNTQTSVRGAGAKPSAGNWMMILGSAAALIDSVFNYFWPGNGVNGTWGALGVVGGSLLILLVSLWLAFGLRRIVWLRWIIALLLLLAVLGNGFCAYLLETPVLEGLMAFTLLGWVVAVLETARAPASLTGVRRTAQ